MRRIITRPVCILRTKHGLDRHLKATRCASELTNRLLLYERILASVVRALLTCIHAPHFGLDAIPIGVGHMTDLVDVIATQYTLLEVGQHRILTHCGDVHDVAVRKRATTFEGSLDVLRTKHTAECSHLALERGGVVVTKHC